ncbi:Protein GrpE [Moorella humiferrea]
MPRMEIKEENGKAMEETVFEEQAKGDGHGTEEQVPGSLDDTAGGHETTADAGKIDPVREELNRLQEELEAKETMVTELQQRLLRLQADFDNYRKRTRREVEDLTRRANARLIEALLPVLDNLERALAASGAEKGALATGVEMTLRQLQEILTREGLTPVAALGQPFNPEVHEAVAREETDAADKINLVVEEFRRGYTLHGRLLRPAMVKVAVAAAETAPTVETGEQEVEGNGQSNRN